MKPLPKSTDEEFWLESGELVQRQNTNHKHVFTLNAQKREVVCTCGLGYAIKPQDIDEVNMLFVHPKLGNFPLS